MPIIRKRIEKLFPQDMMHESSHQLLSTIRVPKNLLYLTDRLPKPNYDSISRKRNEEEELVKRRTYDTGSAMLPEIKNQQLKSALPTQGKKARKADKVSVNKLKSEA